MRVVMQHQREPVQLLVAKALRLDRSHGGQHVVSIESGADVYLLDKTELLSQREPPGILHMAAIDRRGQRTDTLAGLVAEPDRAQHFAIDVGGLLAASQ